MTKPRWNYKMWNRGIEYNILAAYNAANAQDIENGMHWYQNASDIAHGIAVRNGITQDQAAGVIAAISPGLEWGRNVLQAEELVRAFVANTSLPMVGTYGKGNVDKAVEILKGKAPLDVLGGPKVRAFYSCIADPKNSQEVCIDRHAKCLAINSKGTRKGAASNEANAIVKPAEFKYFAWHYRLLAERLGILPHQLQAVTWVAWKRLEGNIQQ